MKQRFTLLLLALLSFTIAFADPIGLELARGKAAKFMKERNNGAVLASEEPEYAPARTIRGVQTQESDPAYYVFNAEDERGYVIISGDDNTDEILGYATSGSFDLENMPENVKAWLQGYAEQIAMLGNYVPQQNTASYNTTWTAVSPLISTKWNQSAPYNNECPVHEGDRSVTGCTATAMAQVMKYHEWPQERTSSIPAYTTETTRLRVSTLLPTIFKWDEMQDSYSSNEDGEAVAKLMRYCGQSIESDYSRISTGAYTFNVAIALKKYFKYDPNLELRNIALHTISEWESIIYNELKEKRPVYHAGYSLNGGHAFVCDGYDGDGMFHFNWGWGGAYDGYYKLTLMAPGVGGIGSGSSDGYSYAQEIIIGIQAPTGEEEKTKYFTPNSEQIVNNTIFSYFFNTYPETFTANVGFATIDENNNIIKVIKDCGPLTLEGCTTQNLYVGIDLEDDGIRLTRGQHRIATVCRPTNSQEWKRVGSYQKYFLVNIGSNGKVSSITQYPQINLAIMDWDCDGNLVAGMPQKITVNLKNEGDEVYTALYVFASLDDNPGQAQSRTAVLMKKNEEASYDLYFTPETYGTYNVWLSDNPNCETYIAQAQVEISPAPTKPSSLTLLSCTPNKNEVSAKVRIRNRSSEPYYRGIVAMLFENLNNDGNLYSTEVLELPGDIKAGGIKTLDFKFHGAKSYNQCAILIGYYANHTDRQYTQLGDYVFFVTEETPVESIEGTPTEKEAPVFRIDGTQVKDSNFKGIFISDGKKMIVK